MNAISLMTGEQKKKEEGILDAARTWCRQYHGRTHRNKAPSLHPSLCHPILHVQNFVEVDVHASCSSLKIQNSLRYRCHGYGRGHMCNPALPFACIQQTDAQGILSVIKEAFFPTQ